MYTSVRWFFSLFLVLSLPALAEQQNLSLEQTLRQIYQPYMVNKDPIPFDATGDARIVSTRMAAALKLDSELTSPGDAGALDWDPRCGCQDFDKLQVVQTTISPDGESQAIARVRIRVFQDSEQTNTVDYRFVLEQGRWLIDDIIENNQSTYQLISDSNQNQQKMLAALQRPEATAFVREVFTSPTFDALSWPLLLSPAARKTLEAYHDLTYGMSAKEQESKTLPDIWETTPLCGCIDPGKIVLNDVQTTERNGAKTRVSVNFTLPDGSTGIRILTLENAGGKWLIEDISDPAGGSLMQRLAHSVASEKPAKS